MYALIENGVVKRYPYTVTDLRRSTPGVSFPNQPDDDTLALYNVQRVFFSEPPAVKDNQVIEQGTPTFDGERWNQVWIVRDNTPEEIAAQAEIVRTERNNRLAACDWTQLSDSTADKMAFATYRQALRDVTAQTSFPWNVTWPEAPQT